VACHEVCLCDIVGGLDGRIAEAQVGNSYAACLLGVVLEVCLNILIGVVTDDFDGVLVCADSTVTAQTPELAGDSALGSRIGNNLFGKRIACNIIDDTDGEMVLRILLCEIVINGKDGSGSCILGAETVSAADNLGINTLFSEGCNNIEIERLAERAGFLCSVENGNLLDRLGQSLCELVCTERTIKSYLYETDLLALCHEVVDNLLGNIAYGSHGDDNIFSLGMTVVVKELVVCAYLLVYFLHVFFHDSGESIVIRVASLSVLEEYIAVFGGAAENGMLGIESACAEFGNGILINHICKILVIPLLDLLNLVRGAEAVKEMDKRNSAFDCGKVSNRAEVHNLLRVCGSEHSEACLTASINIGMIAENVESMRSYTACGNMNNAGKKLTCNLIHIRNHQEQTLRSRVCCSESACRERAVNGTCGTCLRLHFGNSDIFTENILETCSRP